MTLNLTHPKLINFLQQLSQQQGILSYRDMAKKIRVQEKKVSVKTIQHWMNTLKGTQPEQQPQFFYYPAFYNEAIGLTAHIHKGTIPEHLKPWTIYSTILHNYTTEEQINTLLLPKKEKSITPITTGKTIYNLDGTAPEKDYDAIFKEHFKKCEALTQLNSLKKNPLIIPCIFEYQHRATNAQQVWNRFKNKVRNNIEYYCPKTKTEQQGIHAIRTTLKTIQPLIVEPRIEYLPYNQDKDYYHITTKKIGANTLYKHATTLKIYKTTQGYLHIIQTTQQQTENILEKAQELDIQNISIVMKKKTEEHLKNSTLTQFQYEKNYEPRTGTWKDVKV